MSKIPPLYVQFELAMLWRTLSVLKSIDVPSVVLFYQKLIPNLKIMPQLSLSAYWGKNSLVDMHSGNGDIGMDGMGEGKASEAIMATSFYNFAADSSIVRPSTDSGMGGSLGWDMDALRPAEC